MLLGISQQYAAKVNSNIAAGALAAHQKHFRPVCV